MRKHPDQKHLREESMYFGLWFRRGYSPWGWGGMTPGTGGQPSSQKAGWPHFIHTQWGKREWAGRGRQRGNRSGREREGRLRNIRACCFVSCRSLSPVITSLSSKAPPPKDSMTSPSNATTWGRSAQILDESMEGIHIQITEDWQSSKCQAICPRWLQESKDSFSGSFPLCVWDCMWRETYCRANNGGQGPSPK